MLQCTRAIAVLRALSLALLRLFSKTIEAQDNSDIQLHPTGKALTIRIIYVGGYNN